MKKKDYFEKHNGSWSLQNAILKKNGYKTIAPIFDDYYGQLWLVQYNEKMLYLDDSANDEQKEKWNLIGNNLLLLNHEGYHICTPSTHEQTVFYKPKDGLFYFLWDNDDYLELDYLCFPQNEYCNDTFEFIKQDNYVALKYHQQKQNSSELLSESERLLKKPLMDCIISKKNGICHTEVFTYYYKNRIVVFDGLNTIVYDNHFNIIFTNNSQSFEIWEVNKSSYLLFPTEGIIYNLSTGDINSVKHNKSQRWYFAKTYKNIVVFYGEHHFPINVSDFDDVEGGGWDIKTPPLNTYGKIFDASFNLLREFNVIGEIIEIKDVSETIVMKTTEYREGKYKYTYYPFAYSYYNVKGTNQTRFDNIAQEAFSIPEISFRHMPFYTHYHPDGDIESKGLYIVKTYGGIYNTIDFTTKYVLNYMDEKYGVYHRTGSEKYEKIIECKYDYIKALPITDDNNIYYLGVCGKDENSTYDLYINHKIVFQGLVFDKGYSIFLIANEKFIRFKNSEGYIGIIRKGVIILEPMYHQIEVYSYNEEKLEDGMTRQIKKYFFVGRNGNESKDLGYYDETKNLIIPSNVDWDFEEEIGLHLLYSDECIEKKRKWERQRQAYKEMYLKGNEEEET